ncbi:MAG: hypothetical protein GY913_01595 [Proteobacteria bacterium]|nr:hypothetical protein [Pseudomonadota bacterium]MCP4915593.1 hypothetical protein [Pseudomonadota bacterium]
MKKILSLSIAAAGLVACAPGTVDVSFEEDGAYGFEGGPDGGASESALEFYDGGGWRKGTECRDDIGDATGNDIGDITADIELTNQFDETVRLYDFCDRAVLIVSGAFW